MAPQNRMGQQQQQQQQTLHFLLPMARSRRRSHGDCQHGRERRMPRGACGLAGGGRLHTARCPPVAGGVRAQPAEQQQHEEGEHGSHAATADVTGVGLVANQACGGRWAGALQHGCSQGIWQGHGCATKCPWPQRCGAHWACAGVCRATSVQSPVGREPGG
eukprot:1622846-Amphidinium_carterae.1